MKTSVNQIVDAIINQIQAHPEVMPNSKSLKKWLSQAGFSTGDIDAAMKLIAPQMAMIPPRVHRRPGTIRHLNGMETQKLSLDARNALARLEMYELVEPWEREMILDYAMHQEGEVGLDDLEYILQNTILPGRDVETQQTIDAVFNGITDMLH